MNTARGLAEWKRVSTPIGGGNVDCCLFSVVMINLSYIIDGGI